MLGLAAWAGPAEVEVAVWGTAGFQTGDVLVAALVDAEGRPCAVDAEGLRCFDDDGAEAWGLDLPGLDVRDVASGGGTWILYGVEETVVMSDAGADVVRQPAESWVPEGVPADIEVIDVLDRDDGGFGVIDGGGGIVWFDASGQEVADLDLDLAVDDGVRSVPLDVGWALVDDEGVVVLDGEGNIVAEADEDANDLAFADGALWLATDDGVRRMDLDTGEVGDVVIDGEIISLAATDDGDVLAVVDAGGRRLRAWDGDEPLSGRDHVDAVVRLHPVGDGGLVSVDASGRAVHWSDGGVVIDALDGVIDAAYDGAGATWVGRGAGIERIVDDGSGVGDLDAAVATLVPLADGVLVGDGVDAVVRRDARGERVWTNADLPHAEGLGVSGPVVIGLADGVAEVADLGTGSPRRRLTRSGERILAAGVAVGGLVVVGEHEGVVTGWRPPRRTTTEPIDDIEGMVRLAPNGRWGAALRRDGKVVVFETQGRMVYRADAGDEVTALAVDERFVWIGRADGRVERWTVEPLVVDAALPHFNAYAQLEGFVAAPTSLEAKAETGRSEPIVDLAAFGDTVAISSGALDTWTVEADGGVTTWVPVLTEPRRHTVVHWHPELGLLVGTESGRLLAVEPGHERELGRVKGPIMALCTVPGGLLLGTAKGVMRYTDGKTRRLRGGPQGPVGGLACDPEGRWAMALWGGGVVAWDLESGAVLARPRQGGPIRSVGVLPDGTALTGGEDRTVVLWDPSNWQLLATLEGHGGAVVDLAVDAEGLRLVAAGGSDAVVWDLVPLVPVGRLSLGEPVSAVAIADNRSVWLGSTEGAVARYALPEAAGKPVDGDTDEPVIILDIPPPTIAPGALDELPPDER